MRTTTLDAMLHEWLAEAAPDLTNAQAAAVGRTIAVVRNNPPPPVAKVMDSRSCVKCGGGRLITVHCDDYRGLEQLGSNGGVFDDYVTFCNNCRKLQPRAER